MRRLLKQKMRDEAQKKGNRYVCNNINIDFEYIIYACGWQSSTHGKSI